MRFLPVLFFLCSLFISFGQETSYQSLLLNKKLTENADAIIRMNEMHVDIVAQDQMTYAARKVVTVLNRKGRAKARTSLGYDKENKIKKIEVFIYDKMGREIEHIKKKDFEDVSAADGFSLYLDNRILYYDYKPASYPYTVAFSFEMETTDTGVLWPWYVQNGYRTSVEKGRYSLRYPSNALKPVVKEENMSKIDLVKSDQGGYLKYSVDTIPAIKWESLSPDFSKIAPKLLLRLPNFHYKGHNAKVDNWKDLGTWMDKKLLEGRTALPEGTVNKAKLLVKGVTDDLEKAKIIYQYVQDNTRYISVQIGIGGFRPISAVEVDRVKYGDCKGLSNYTKALLEAVDVPSYYTVIQAGNDKIDFYEDFADLRQGNHAILAIPYQDQYYWIDCTSQVHPFGFVGDFTDDRKALVVTPEGGEIVRTVAYLNKENAQVTKAKYSLSAEGGISGETLIATRGVQYDQHFNLETQKKEDVIEYYKEFWSNINNLNIGEFGFENDRNEVVFKETVTFDASDYASVSGKRMLFVINALNKNTNVPKRYRNREQPFEIQRGFYDEDAYEIQLPEGYELESLPEMVETDTEFGSYCFEVSHDPEKRTLAYKRSLLVKQGEYSKEKYNLYRDFRKQVARGDKAQAVLLKTGS
ncbi:DUF3857 domain-containing transglutaminase family protein [Maribacter sp. 2-571]|uniref:DUF3857 domain-containing transglutaminase family protein n=1 Tax=Maribacter sp. 2-571 TaxID=3417569 RepID=UPI003D349317